MEIRNLIASMFFCVLIISYGHLAFGQQALPAQTTSVQLPDSDLEKISQSITNSAFFKETLGEQVRSVATRDILTLTVLAGFILGAFSTVWACKEWYKSKIKTTLDEAFYQVDARKIRVWIPEKNFDIEVGILKKWGFDNLKTYNHLAKAHQTGCVIMPCTSQDEEDQIVKFIAELSTSNAKVGVVAYTAGKPWRINHENVAQFPFFQIANGPSTIPSALWNLTRGLC